MKPPRSTRPSPMQVLLIIAAVLVGFAGGFGTSMFVRSPVTVRSTGDRLALTNLADDRRLSGVAQNIFMGDVLSLVNVSEEMEDLPETQYLVRISENLKGQLTGLVTVNQLGGFDVSLNSVVLFNDDPIIQVGRSYLFVTRSRPFPDGTTWNTVVANYGALPIDTADQRAGLRARFQAAIEEEITFDSKELSDAPFLPRP